MLMALRVLMSKLPWPVWAVAGAVTVVAGTYFKGRADGKAVVRAEYAEMALKTAKQARWASENATTIQDQRDADFADNQREIEDAVKEAIESGSDPVAAYFDELRAAQSRGR
jgi:C-terminal processing protease CtpA/Prc